MTTLAPMIIVTGANGFIGSAMVWELNQRGITDIICVDSVPLEERDLLKKLKYSEFLSKDDLWSYLLSFESRKTKWIIHMGACSSTTETNWDFLKENNLEYSQKIFQWSAEHKVNVIYASSAATYGAGELGFNDTTDPKILKPLNRYGESKVQMDRWALKQKRTPPNWYGLKFFNVFGPQEYSKGSMASVAFKAFQQIKSESELGLFKSHNPKYKDGEQLRDFVYVKDVTSWICELMDKKPENGIYNMGFGQARTWLDLAGSVFRALDQPIKIRWLDVPANIRDQYQYYTQARMEKWLAQGLSQPKWSLEKAIDDYIKNYLTQEDPFL